MTTVLMLSVVVVALLLLSYLAESAWSCRWLTPRQWLARVTCSHVAQKLVSIEWDGEAIYKCADCGKRSRRPL
jgi:hypothetical protein